MGDELWKLAGSLKLDSLIPVGDLKRRIYISYHSCIGRNSACQTEYEYEYEY